MPVVFVRVHNHPARWFLERKVFTRVRGAGGTTWVTLGSLVWDFGGPIVRWPDLFALPSSCVSECVEVKGVVLVFF